MSGVSSALAISVYLTASKNEQAQVAKYVKSDPVTQGTVSAFENSAATLGSSQAILANYKALQVLTGAYNMSGQINSRAILSDLMTQSADSTTSLVQQSANTDYLHFARATQNRSTDTVALGGAGFTTGGASASTLTVQNLAWISSKTPTAASPAIQWSFVTNDGSAGSSIAAALNAASQAAGGPGGYSINASGIVSNTAGGPAVTTSTDANGNTTYSLPITKDSSGNVVKSVDVVSVKVAAGGTPAASTAQAKALTGALVNAGFDASLSPSNTLSVTAPATVGVQSLANSVPMPIATATASTVDPGGRLMLGNAGKTLVAGQILMDGNNVIGTVKSVDMFGTVTMTATPTTQIAAGDTISLATGLSLSNINSTMTAGSASAAGSKTLSLGAAGLGLQPGQVISSGGTAVGTVGSVDSRGNVTLLAPSTAAVAQGSVLSVSPAVGGVITPALSDASNVASIVSSYETNAYESSMGQQYPGLDDALYYTRTMGSITSITQLMSNARLLKVVTTSLGMGNYFGSLDYTQQVAILTNKINIAQMTSPDGIKKTSLQYLISEAANTVTTPTGIAALYSPDGGLSSQDLFGLTNGIQPSSTTMTNSSDPVLSLFT
ncbi:DUF1217 domain-containing protein [Acetobacteraceae bacterium KSS8]|uniref:DUF1217 domain-containing protein n=1 Tax=Endosaccharibacter trunci TaxID=2812733 RepID=A0ABT1WCV1_9PROT|nr:DUF1217 domain-containing protein [Acetobacteraceae bacterium KSS8]